VEDAFLSPPYRHYRLLDAGEDQAMSPQNHNGRETNKHFRQMPDQARPEAAPALDPNGMSAFTSFAISMSIICILSGGITSFHVGFCSVGGAAIGLGWPLCCLFSLIVALTMGQLASAFPRAGGPYQWAAILGGRGWGWVTACFGLAGLVTVLAAVNVGTCQFALNAIAQLFDWQRQDVVAFMPALAVILMTASQALFNHWGIRLTGRLIDLSGYLIMVVAAVLTAAMVLFGVILGPGLDLDRLVTFTNYSGPAGGDVVPATADMAWLFALGLLLPAYTITGFDGPAQTAEETVDPSRNVPRGIVRGVVLSAMAGWIMLTTIVLAIPNMDEAARQGDQSFFWIIQRVIPQPLRTTLYVGLIAAMYLCGLACLTSVSRLTYAFARDGGLPFSKVLRRIGTHRSPSVAIWTSAAITALFAVEVSYETNAAVCAAFLYIAYVLPTALGLWAHKRAWTRMGPWHLGRWYRPLGVVSVLACMTLLVICVQPPNERAVGIIGVMIAGLFVLWFGYMRRHFPGPPQEVLDQLRLDNRVAGEAAPANCGADIHVRQADKDVCPTSVAR
jgi:amino acid transporter